MGGGNRDGRAREFFVTDRPPQGPDRPPHKTHHSVKAKKHVSFACGPSAVQKLPLTSKTHLCLNGPPQKKLAYGQSAAGRGRSAGQFFYQAMPGTWSDFAQRKRPADRPLIGADRPPLTSLLFSKKKIFLNFFLHFFKRG